MYRQNKATRSAAALERWEGVTCNNGKQGWICAAHRIAEGLERGPLPAPALLEKGEYILGSHC